LVERTGLETNQYGFKFKLNRDMVGYFESNRIDVELDTANSKPHWDIPEPNVLRNKDSILKVQNLSYKYGSDLPWILRDISLNIELGDKVGIVSISHIYICNIYYVVVCFIFYNCFPLK